MLPESFRPQATTDLIRLGRDWDGGYVIPKSVLKQTTHLIGMGLCDDWSFEVDFQNRSGCMVTVFDHTVDGKFFIKRFAIDFVRFLAGRAWPSELLKYFGYRRYFCASGKGQHLREMIGPEEMKGVTVAEIQRRFPNGNIFFKIDIEGSEYRILDELKQTDDRILGYVAEFHDVDLHFDRIRDFIENSNLKLVHIHANNFAPVHSKIGPTVLELTFVKPALCKGTQMTTPPNYPIVGVDIPNDPKQPDVVLTFGGSQ